MRTLITDVRLVDGAGAPARLGELLIEDDRIAALEGVPTGIPGPDRVVEGAGRVLAPGFIDIHSHGDFVLPSDPEAGPKVRQGITTEVVANCGLGLAPANDRVDTMYRQYGRLFGEDGASDCSPTLDAYRRRLEALGVSVHVACLVPHGNVRCAVLGMAERAPSPAELRAMETLVAEGMADGAFGLSSGLVYPPGAYADTEELVRLAQVAGAAGGLYATHVRDEGRGLEAAIAEAIAIGETGGAPVQISHHKASGRPNWGKVARTLGMVEAAAGRGLDVTSDMYPYTAGSTMLAAMIVPLWVWSAGSPEESLARLADPELRPRLIREARRRLEELIVLPGWLDWLPKRLLVPAVARMMADKVVIASVKRQKRFEGKTLREVGQMRGQPLLEALFDLLVEEEAAITVTVHVLDEDDVRTVLAHPLTMVGTDGMPTLEGRPHPRTFGTYPRVLEHYVGRLGLFSLEAAIHKMTGLPARKLGLADRGRLEPGAVADLVLFEPRRIRDRATYRDPARSPVGIDHVWVAGVPVVDEGAHTGARPGRVLRRTRGPTRVAPVDRSP